MASNSESDEIPDDIEYQSMNTNFHELQSGNENSLSYVFLLDSILFLVFQTSTPSFSQTMSSSNLPASIDS